MTEYTPRLSGRTTNQILALPDCSMFLVKPGAVPYTRKLVYDLGRTDVLVVSAANNNPRMLPRTRYIGVDHAAVLPRKIHDLVLELQRRWLAAHPEATAPRST